MLSIDLACITCDSSRITLRRRLSYRLQLRCFTGMIDTAYPHVRKILVLNDSAQLNAFQLSSL